MKNTKILAALITASTLFSVSAFAQQTTTVTTQTAQVALTQSADLYVDGVKTVEGVMAYSSNLITFSQPGQHTVSLVVHGAALGAPGSTIMSSNYQTANPQTTVKLNIASDYSAFFY